MKDLGKSTSQPRSHDLANTHHICRVAAEIILQLGLQIIVQVWVSKLVKGKQHNFQMITLI